MEIDELNQVNQEKVKQLEMIAQENEILTGKLESLETTNFELKDYVEEVQKKVTIGE